MRLGIALLVAALVGAGCGGGDDSDSLPDTVQELTTTVAPAGRALADWQEASSAVCEEYNPRIAAAVASIQAQTTDQGVIDEVRKGLVLTLEYLDRLRTLPVPTERSRQVERLNDRLDRAQQAVAGQRRDLEAGDYAGVTGYLGVLTNYTDTDELYESLDVQECVSPQG